MSNDNNEAKKEELLEKQEARKLTEEELEKVVGGNPGSNYVPEATAHQWSTASGCVFSRNCQAASKAECPFGGLKAGEEQDCPKFD